MKRIVQLCFGAPGKGGPATALAKFLDASNVEYAVVWQERAAGGISIRQIWSMARQIRRHRPALVHVRGLGNEGFHGVLAARLGGAGKILLSIHGTQRDLQSGNGGLRRFVVINILEPLSIKLADRITTVCEFTARRRFLDRYRSKLVAPIPNGVPLPDTATLALRNPTRASMGIGESELVFVAVSRLSVEKGYDDLAQASAQAATQGVKGHIVIVGDGPDRRCIETAFATVHGLKVHFVGHQDDVRPYLRAADVFVFPTWHENLSNALIEALAHGLPTIATDVGGNTEVLYRGGGLLVPVRNPAALANAMVALSADARLRSQLATQAVANVAVHYSLTAMVQAWESLYEHLIAGREK